MQTTMDRMDLDELDALVEHLDTQITHADLTDDTRASSLLLCSGGCGGSGPWSWHWC